MHAINPANQLRDIPGLRNLYQSLCIILNFPYSVGSISRELFKDTHPPLSIVYMHVHATHIEYMDKVGHVAAGPGPLATAIDPLACPSRIARLRKFINPT